MNAFKLLRAGQGQTEGASRGGGADAAFKWRKIGVQTILYFYNLVYELQFFSFEMFYLRGGGPLMARKS